LKGGKNLVKKAIVLIVSLFFLFAFAVGCKQAETPKPEAPKPAEAPAPAPPETPAEAPPPPEKQAAAPDVVVVPSGTSYVYMAPDVPGIYFYHGYWYRYYKRYWYQTAIYGGPWVYIEASAVPLVVVDVPPDYIYRLPRGYYRIHYHDLYRHWRTWDHSRHWNRYDWYRHERWRHRGDHRPHGDGYKPRGRDHRPRGDGYKPRGRDHRPRGDGYKPRGRDHRPRGDGYKPPLAPGRDRVRHEQR
jgi:hypothetical protein